MTVAAPRGLPQMIEGLPIRLAAGRARSQHAVIVQ
jgi:hypothetical protein